MYIGIDGCRKGWVVASIDTRNNLSLEIIDELDALTKLSSSLILIDMPMGFPESNYRPCEMEARVILGKERRSSIFFTPHPKAVYANSHAEANAINKQYIGKGISMQAWNICKKIRQLHEFRTENMHLRMEESHPELCFSVLNNNKVLLSKKSKPDGIAERKKLIAHHSKDYVAVIQQAMLDTKREDVKVDDFLDATVMAIRASAGNLNYAPTTAQNPTCDRIAY